MKIKTITPPLQPVASEQNFPWDMLQIDIVGQLPTSHNFKYILTAIDVFSRYLFAIPMTNQGAETTAKNLVSIFMRHSYLPKVILSDLGTAFTSNLLAELAQLLQVRLKHATLKHAQTIGLLERSHAALKRVLKVNENEWSSDWNKYVDIGCFVHNTSYHSAIQCTPSLLFHGREPITPIDLRFQTSTKSLPSNNYHYITTLHSKMSELFSSARENVVRSYQKYKAYYDRKCAATPLEVHSYCLLLDPKIAKPNQSFEKQKTKWLPLYRVEVRITNNNYIVRKTNTKFTQCVHRIRLRPIKPKYDVQDLESIDPAEFVQDPTIDETQQEPMLFDEILEKMLDNDQNENIKTHHPRVSIKESNNTTVTIPLPETQSNERPMNEGDEAFTVVGHTLPTPTQVGHSADYIEVPPHIEAACSRKKERIHPRYNFRKGDRMTAVRTQCSEQLNARPLQTISLKSETKEAESRIEFYFVPNEEERDESDVENSDIGMETNDSSYDACLQNQEDRSDVETGSLDRTTVFTTDNDMDELRESDMTSDLFIDDEPIALDLSFADEGESSTISFSPHIPEPHDDEVLDTALFPQLHNYLLMQTQQIAQPSSDEVEISTPIRTITAQPTPNAGYLSHSTPLPTRREQQNRQTTDAERSDMTTPTANTLRRRHRLSTNWNNLEMQVVRQQNSDGEVENFLTLGPRTPDRE